MTTAGNQPEAVTTPRTHPRTHPVLAVKTDCNLTFTTLCKRANNFKIMSKRGSVEATVGPAKKSKSETSLVSVSTSLCGSYTVTGYITIDAIYWRDATYTGCRVSSRKVHKQCSRHPDTPTKLFYRLRVLLKQDNAELWVTAFSDIAETIMGMSADQFNALDKSGQMKAVDHVVGLKFVVHIGKRMRNGYTNYVLNKIFPARTIFSDDIIDQV